MSRFEKSDKIASNDLEKRNAIRKDARRSLIKQLREQGHDIPGIRGQEIHHFAFPKRDYREPLRASAPIIMPTTSTTKSLAARVIAIGLKWAGLTSMTRLFSK